MPRNDGALAQLGERLHGMQEVSGSIPLGSTIFLRDRLALVISEWQLRSPDRGSGRGVAFDRHRASAGGERERWNSDPPPANDEIV